MNNPLIAEVAADVLGSASPEPADEALPALWSTVVELDWPLVSIDEDSAGAGGTLDDLLTLISAVAESGISLPLAEAAVARWALVDSGHDPAGLVVPASADAEGALHDVPWARHAQHLVVWREQREPLLVDLAESRIERSTNLAGEPRDTVVLPESGGVALPQAPSRPEMLARAALLNAAGIVGAARGAHEITRTHVTQRHQFGRPLIAVKSVASALATMRTDLVSAEAALGRAREAHERDDAETLLAGTATAKIRAARAATSIARNAHQLHGAMGVTQEHSLHHVTRKLWAWRDEHGSERSWAIWLGREARALGEDALWTDLTAGV